MITNRRRVPYYFAALVSVTTLAVYLPALRNDFVNIDDNIYVYENSNIHSLKPEFFKWAFSSFYASNWHPLAWVSHAIDYAVWGLNPAGHHLTNNILHAINTFVVVLLCIKLLKGWKELSKNISSFLDERRIMITAGVTGLLFGIHPLHVESVAWVAERKDLMCGLFFLLSISAYVQYVSGLLKEPVEKKTSSIFLNRPYLFSLTFFVFAILSKPMSVSLPVVLLILDWYPFQRIRSFKSLRYACMEKMPFIVLSLISSILTIMAQSTGRAMGMMAFVPLRVRMLVSAKAFVAYLVHMAAPVGLSSYYSYPMLQEVALLSPQYFFPVVLLVGITSICLLAVKRQKLWLSVWGYYIVTLIPVIGIIQVGSQSMADRYTYLPSLGPFLLVGLIAAFGWAKTDLLKKWRRIVKGCTIAVAVSLVISLSYATIKQITIWRDSLTFSAYMVRMSPDAAMPHKVLGTLYLNLNRFDEAVAELSTALKLNPDFALAHANLGAAYLNLNRFGEAVAESLAALKLRPDLVIALNNLGWAYINLNRLDEAANELNTALKLRPDFAPARYNLEICYERMKTIKQ